MLGLSGEHLLILFVVLLFFGPKRLPQIGATLGRTARKFRETFNGIPEPKYKKIREYVINQGGTDDR